MGLTKKHCQWFTVTKKKNACADATIFKDWFQNQFVPIAKEKLIELGVEPEVPLVMDNRSAHPSEEKLNTDDGSAKYHFLTTNVTSLIQPMDQGVLERMKRIYRKSLLTIYLKRSHFDIHFFNRLLWRGWGREVWVCEAVALQKSVALFGRAFLKNSFIRYFWLSESFLNLRVPRCSDKWGSNVHGHHMARYRRFIGLSSK